MVQERAGLTDLRARHGPWLIHFVGCDQHQAVYISAQDPQPNLGVQPRVSVDIYEKQILSF